MFARVSVPLLFFFIFFYPFSVSAHEPHVTQEMGDLPMLPGHLSQEDITSRKLSFDQIFAAGKRLFDAKFNTLDGQGRPYATGNGKPTGRAPNLDMPMVRTSGPDSNACAGCHNDPRSGAGGDFVANVFVLAQVLDPITYSVDPDFSNERNTLGMMGAGPIELLGREMTRDLHRLRERAKAAAAASGLDVTLPLESKGVSFGSITARPDGTLDFSRLEGVDNDLIIKPFHQKGVVRSLREFTVRSVLLGTLLGLVFGASSLYLVLKVGLTVSASIPVAVISITLFKLWARLGGRDATILEHNITQTAGSAGESIPTNI